MTTATRNADTAIKPPFGRPGRMLRFRLARLALRLLLGGTALVIRCRDDGRRWRLGGGKAPGFEVELDSVETLWTIMRDPDPGLGEAYMDDRWRLVSGDLGQFLTVLARNRQRLVAGPAGALLGRFLLRDAPDHVHDEAHDRGYVQHHYDIGDDLYESFLDEGLNYSCAFFPRPDASLREAQLAKLRTTIARLDVQAGMSVLDIGCGWGEATRLVATETGAAEVVGITLAENQARTAQARAASLATPPRYQLEDYRAHAARCPAAYDRIFSIGMFEHVGTSCHGEFFGALARLLRPGGRALVHSIIRSSEPATRTISSTWLDRYIFPGGAIPEVETMVAAARSAGLRPLGEPFVHEPFHYAETLRRWRANFIGHADRLDTTRYDDNFRRMWEFYLAMCEAIFEGCGFRVAQVVVQRPPE